MGSLARSRLPTARELSIHESGIFPSLRALPISMATPDDLLVEAMIRNEAAAWREFQRRFDRVIHRCITKVTRRFASVLTSEDTREIYSMLLVSLVANDHHKLRTFDEARGNRLSSWLGLLAINCAYDYLRAVRREPGKGSLAEAVDVASEQPDPYEHAAQRQRARIAARTLEHFSARDRTFAALYFGEGMAPEEIARSLKISVKTVYSKKHKIQTRLESLLANARDEGDAAA